MSYITHSVPLTDGQITSLRAAAKASRGLTLRIGTSGKLFPLLLTKTQISYIGKARRLGHGAYLKLSKAQVAAMKKNGGFFPLLAAIPGLIAGLASSAAPAIAAAAPAVLGALGTGALSGAAGYGVNRILQATAGKGLRLGPPPFRGNGLHRRKKNRKH